MLLTAILIGISSRAALAFFYPPDCLPNCECKGPSVTCSGGIIPDLDKRLTHFTIEDADQPIRTLTSTITRKLDHLVSLHIISVGLESIQDGALGIIPRLENLDIAHNKIKRLASTHFENCSQLIELNLQNNEIEIIENDTFTSLDTLKKLSLAHNSIKSLPNYLPPSIQSLDIEGNQIAEIQNFVFDELTSLNLCNNQFISTDDVKTDMRSLVELCLGGLTFRLKENTINFNKFPVLENLRLAGHGRRKLKLTPPVMENILNMASQTLNTLTMESCSLFSLAIFHQPNSKLQKIKASNITLMPPNRAMPPSTNTQTIMLPSVKIFDLSGSPSLASLFIYKPSKVTLTELTILRLSNCGIVTFPESVLLSKTPAVTTLDLSHNPLRCTCSGLSWVKKYVFDDRLSLIMEEKTVCDFPDHLKGIPLLTATMCPLPAPNLNATARTPTTDVDVDPTPTATNPVLPLTVGLRENSGSSTVTLGFQPENVTNITPRESRKHNSSSTDLTQPTNKANTTVLKVTITALVILTAAVATAVVTAVAMGVHCYRRKSMNVNQGT